MIRTKIMILESNGEIDELDRDFKSLEALSRYVCRFTALFVGDVFGRAIRIIDRDTKKVFMSYDSVSESFTVSI